jgi:hypothetical protein
VIRISAADPRSIVHSFLARVLLVEREWQADRTTVVLVREPVGV